MPALSHKRFTGLFLTAAMLLAACSQATGTTVSTEKPNISYTAAAETIIAQLTEIAAPATQIPSSDANPLLTQAATESMQSAQAPAATATQSLSPSVTPTETEIPAPVDTPTETAAPTETEAPTETAAPTPTFVPGDPKANLGSPTWRDTFDNALNWPLYEDEHVSMQIQNNRLVMTALNADKYVSWMLTWPVLENFYYEITVSPGRCQGRDHYGLAFRAPDENRAYLFGVSCDGQYSLRRWDGRRMT